MATTTLSSATIIPPTVTINPKKTNTATNKVVYINGLNSYGGLKAHNKVVGLGSPVCTEQSFANVVSSMKKIGNKSSRGGGALTSTCTGAAAVAEIFKIAAIMNGLTLVGVAVGFVLLRIEATVEESE